MYKHPIQFIIWQLNFCISVCNNSVNLNQYAVYPLFFSKKWGTNIHACTSTNHYIWAHINTIPYEKLNGQSWVTCLVVISDVTYQKRISFSALLPVRLVQSLYHSSQINKKKFVSQGLFISTASRLITQRYWTLFQERAWARVSLRGSRVYNSKSGHARN
jgi:hypothetical protein